MKAILPIVSLFFIGNASAQTLTESLAAFVKCNSDQFVNVFPITGKIAGNSSSTTTFLRETRLLASRLSKTGLLVRNFAGSRDEVEAAAVTGDYPGNPPKFPITDFNLFVFENANLEKVREAFEFIGKYSRPKKSMMLIQDQTLTEETMKEHLRESSLAEDLSSLFYIALMTENENGVSLKWLQILTLKGQPGHVVWNELEFQGKSLCIEEDYELQGLNITSIALTWAPYLTIDNCDSEGKNCHDNYGALIDVADMLGRMFNFTMISTKDPHDEWGVYPKSGCHDYTGEWHGVMGKVVLGEYASSLSEWRYFIERNPLMDFVPTSADYLYLVLTPQPPEVDMDLFIRPFTDDAWVSTGAMVGVLLVSMIVPYLMFPEYFENTHSFRVVQITTMLFFVLINAFYGGAMTMFFTSEIRVPFEGIRDVMRDDSWMLIVQHGNEVNYQFQRDAGDPDYLALWDRIENDPEETIFTGIGNGLKLLREGRNVMHVFRGMLQGWLREHPFHQQRLHAFGNERALYQTIIFTKHSPLTPVFKLGMRRLRENSILGQIYSMWEGREVGKSENSAAKTVLTPGQVVLVFMVMTLAVMISVALLCLEKFWRRAEYSLALLLESSGVPGVGRINRMGQAVTDAFMRGGDLMVHDLKLT